MRVAAITILALFLAVPAFAGAEFCEIANPGNCISHSEIDRQDSAATVSLAAARATLPETGLQAQNEASQNELAFLETGYQASLTPTHR